MRRVVAFLAAAVAVVATAGPARAGGPAGGGGLFGGWTPMTCTTGGIDRAELRAGDQFLTLDWHLDCAAPADSRPTYGYGRYVEKLGGEVRSLQEYAPTAPTLYAGAAYLPTDVAAICAVTDYKVRVVCVKVERDPVSNAAVAVRPLPTDDPLVDVRLSYNPGVESSPACGGCW
ncbi:hypothetical protein ACTMTJ_19205 [Phytohabitans sp. LJ34]|uniref:hypothetical protein n=1 Tax=Phytohabitans sp. LJ34 TaxID=3452217 RepID=UPI003F89DB1E